MSKELPELPNPVRAVVVMVSAIGSTHKTPGKDYYTADQMRTYAAQAVEVDRAARGVPDGWVLVPIEATTEMVLALMGTGLRNTEYKSKAASPSIEEMKQGYRAMLAAAPQPAEQPEPERLRHVGDSTFESWYAGHPKSIGGDKQLARDAYAAGMSDPAAQPERKPMTREHRKALIESAINARDDDGLITDMEREAHSETNRMMTEALTQAEAARGVPDGQVLAPKEPTTEMILALMGTGLRHAEYRNKAASPSIEEMKQGYRAMLAAAPQPAAQPERKPMTRDEIRAEWDKFIEYPSESRLHVITTSALLFAEHIAQKCIKDTP